MQYFKKIFMVICAIFIYGLLTTGTSYASDNSSDEGALLHDKVKISLINNETGEVSYIDTKGTNITPMTQMNTKTINPYSAAIVEGYNVYIPIESLESSGIIPRDIQGGQTTSGGVTAKLYVDYDTNATNEQVRLNKVYGSWTPSDSMYTVTTRKVNAHSGVGTGKSLAKTPTTNSFSYTTGWGYNYRVGGDAVPRAWSSAVIKISGMTATHTIKVEFTYSW